MRSDNGFARKKGKRPMKQLSFTTTGSFDLSKGFGCASLGLPGVCGNDEKCVVAYPRELEAVELVGTYEEILAGVGQVKDPVQAAVILFGNVGGENTFLAELQKVLRCPIVGGGAAIDFASNTAGLITGRGEAALLLITDNRYTYQTDTLCIHDQILGTCALKLADPRTILTINDVDAVEFYNEKRRELGLADTDFEHLTLSDQRGVNAHLSKPGDKLCSGRDLQETMVLRYVDHAKVYETMRNFYDDKDAIVFGCAGLSGILDKPLDTKSLGLFLFGEVCMAEGYAEFGNLMLSKLKILPK